MASYRVRCSKMADIEAVLPGFKQIWPTIKAATGSSQRCPKSVVFTDSARPVYLNDGEMGKRFALDLRTMQLSNEVYHISSGEWACHGGPNNDREVTGIPDNMALLTVSWHDYYRTFTVEIQVNRLPEQLSQGQSQTV